MKNCRPCRQSCPHFILFAQCVPGRRLGHGFASADHIRNMEEQSFSGAALRVLGRGRGGDAAWKVGKLDAPKAMGILLQQRSERSRHLLCNPHQGKALEAILSVPRSNLLTQC